ncbi:MAG: hypothetical protein ACOY0T_08400 [Myxococcota bacterium]
MQRRQCPSVHQNAGGHELSNVQSQSSHTSVSTNVLTGAAQLACQ